MKILFSEAANITNDRQVDLIFKQTSDTFFAELLAGWLPPICGKTKSLDILFAAREEGTPSHLRKVSATLPEIFNEYCFKAKRQEFCDCIARHLHKQSGISLEESYKTVNIALSKWWNPFIIRAQPFIAKGSTFLIKLNPPNWLDIGIRKVYRMIISVHFPLLGKNYSPTSKYYDEINQIHLSILSNASEFYESNG
jgi:hypothetical protein